MVEDGILNAPRNDALWKRVLRDIRHFYKILLRNRFYSYNYRNDEYKVKWVKIFVEEMKLPLILTNSECLYFFSFIHQTQKKKKNKKYNKYDEVDGNPFWAIDCYNNKTRASLISHPITSRMIYFVIKNFRDVMELELNRVWAANYNSFC